MTSTLAPDRPASSAAERPASPAPTMIRSWLSSELDRDEGCSGFAIPERGWRLKISVIRSIELRNVTSPCLYRNLAAIRLNGPFGVMFTPHRMGTADTLD